MNCRDFGTSVLYNMAMSKQLCPIQLLRASLTHPRHAWKRSVPIRIPNLSVRAGCVNCRRSSTCSIPHSLKSAPAIQFWSLPHVVCAELCLVDFWLVVKPTHCKSAAGLHSWILTELCSDARDSAHRQWTQKVHGFRAWERGLIVGLV